MALIFVTATRWSQAEFDVRAPLSRSLARAGRLQTQGVRFDPQFDFHLYDLDFCRSAQAAGLSLGTWPLAMTHASGGGGYFSPDWQRDADAYLKKWGA